MVRKFFVHVFPIVASVGFLVFSSAIWLSRERVTSILASVSVDNVVPFVTFVGFGAGALLFCSYTRYLGWFLAGNAMAAAILSCSLLKSRYPEGFNFDGNSYNPSALLVLLGATAAGACFLLLWHGITVATNQRDKVKTLKNALQESEKRVKRKETDNEELHLKRVESEGKHEKAIQELLKQKNQEVKLHEITRKWRPYESQLAMQFAIALSSEWLAHYPNTTFVLNNLQGNLDRYLADIFAGTKGRFWLAEMKRDRESIKSEWKKDIRMRQWNKMEKRPEMKQIAGKCHWLVWGEGFEDAKIVLRFSPYWHSKSLESDSGALIDAREFVGRAFSSDVGDAVGVSFAEMKEYLRFLFEGAEADGTMVSDRDSFVLLTFSLSPTGNLNCWYLDVDSLGSIFMRTISREREMERHRFPTMSHDRDDREIDPPGWGLSR